MSGAIPLFNNITSWRVIYFANSLGIYGTSSLHWIMIRRTVLRSLKLKRTSVCVWRTNFTGRFCRQNNSTRQLYLTICKYMRVRWIKSDKSSLKKFKVFHVFKFWSVIWLIFYNNMHHKLDNSKFSQYQSYPVRFWGWSSTKHVGIWTDCLRTLKYLSICAYYWEILRQIISLNARYKQKFEISDQLLSLGV